MGTVSKRQQPDQRAENYFLKFIWKLSSILICICYFIEKELGHTVQYQNTSRK